jgi:ubiquinone/menaquinone biosynthesis C-methylase UbiE
MPDERGIDFFPAYGNSIKMPGPGKRLLNCGVSMSNEQNRVCPVELASSLDSRIRRWLQDPRRILAPYVKEGMRVLDVGCGPGFFSVEMATMVGPGGLVIAADLQEGMLQKLSGKIRGTPLESRIRPVQCTRDAINVSEQVDFILAFYMIHEVPDRTSLFRQLKSILNPQGEFLVVEPKLFHVSRKEFEGTMQLAKNAGFRIDAGPGLAFSWSALLRNN